MTRKNRPADQKRQPLAKGWIYTPDGKPLSPLEQLSNVIDAIVEDPLWEECVAEGKVSDEELRRVDEVIKKAISWGERLEAKKRTGRSRAD